MFIWIYSMRCIKRKIKIKKGFEYNIEYDYC